jgi:acyl-[acyl carrier protein]--UDP-N-acetylglucosamine O-acyltransferase
MSLWLKLLRRFERHALEVCQGWNHRQFLLFEKPRHKAVELGRRVTFNVPVRGGQGILRVGDDTMFGFPMANRLGNGGIMLQTRGSDAEITIGRGNAFSNNTVLCAMQSIRIGDGCRIGDNVAIYDADFHELDPATRDRSAGVVKPVVIGDNVWIGSRAMVLRGATIGNNAVIGAMSLVTKEIPPNCVAAGIPAKVLRTI